MTLLTRLSSCKKASRWIIKKGGELTIILSGNSRKTIQNHGDGGTEWVSETMPHGATGKGSMSVERSRSDPLLFMI